MTWNAYTWKSGLVKCYGKLHRSPRVLEQIVSDSKSVHAVRERIVREHMEAENALAMDRALASPEMAALHADGALFIGGNKTFVVEEKVII